MEEQQQLRVAVVGCGQISWIHLSHLIHRKLGTVVGICDFDRGQLDRTALAFGIQNTYTSIDDLLAEQHPYVVHIVTPPFTHAKLATAAMRAGSHVLIEKPMATSVEECDRIIAVSRETGKRVCVDHNRLFSPGTLEARRYLESGELGQLISVDFYQGFGVAPGTTLAALKAQWHSRLAGGLVEDLAPHCLSFLVEFVGLPKRFHVLAKPTGVLPVAPAEEVRLIVEGEKILGTGTISLSAQPFMNHLTLYGSKMTVRYKLDNLTLLIQRDRFTHPLMKKLRSIDEGKQLIGGALRNVRQVITRKLPRYPDIYEVIRRFYGSLQAGSPPPVTMEQGREVVRLIQEINTVMASAAGAQAVSSAPSLEPVAPDANDAKPTVLITGASGLVGGALLQRLRAEGFAVRALVRPSMRTEKLAATGADLCYGDILDSAALDKAFAGIDMVYHCAARMGPQGSWEDFYRDNVTGTERVLEAAQRAGVRQFIYLSSMAVYGMAKNGTAVAENAAYDPEPVKRGHYSHSKIKAELVVRDFAAKTGLPVTIFRPGQIFGRGKPLPSAPLAFRFGQKFIVIGKHKCLLGLNYLENLVDALVMVVGKADTIGRTFNIIDDEQLTNGGYHMIRSKVDQTRATFISPLPFRIAAPFMEPLAARSGKAKLASFSSHALKRVLKSTRYDTTAIRQLGWQPRVPLEQALKETSS